MRTLLLVVFFGTLVVGNAYGQKSSGASSMRPPLPLAAPASEIKNLRPEVSDDILYRDAEVVEDVRDNIQYIYSKREFNSREADSALLYGWQQLRVKVLAPNSALTREMLVNYVSGFGKLIIKSTPAGAVVEVDGSKLSDKTNAVAWPSAGTYRIKLSLDGYHPVEDTCLVAEGKPALFERTLKPIKRKAETAPKHTTPPKQTKPPK